MTLDTMQQNILNLKIINIDYYEIDGEKQTTVLKETIKRTKIECTPLKV